jgi:O-antigen/teichoic acid export membrane protein
LTRAAATIFRNLETRLQTSPCWLRTMLLDRFFRIGTLLFLATLVSNLLNFLFQVTMGRMLTPADYGTMNALLSTFMIAAIPFTTISMVLTREVSFLRAEGQLAGVRRLFYWTYKRVGTVGLPALAVFLLLSPAVRQFLRIDTTTPVILLGVVIFLSVSFPVNLAFLSGLQNFVPVAVASGALGPLKYGFCVLFVVLGLGLNGVFIGHIFCYLALLLVSSWPLRLVLSGAVGIAEKPRRLFIAAHPELLANLAFAFMTQFDLVLVKHLFSPDVAGTYAVAAVFGRAVLYLPTGLIMVLFPIVAENYALNRNQTNFLWKALVYTLVLSGSGTLLYCLFPEVILGVLFPGRYIAAAPLLALYGVAMLPMALLLITMNFHIARGHRGIWLVIAVGAATEVLAILLWHENLGQILRAVCAGGLFALLLSVWPLLRRGKR